MFFILARVAPGGVHDAALALGATAVVMGLGTVGLLAVQQAATLALSVWDAQQGPGADSAVDAVVRLCDVRKGQLPPQWASCAAIAPTPPRTPCTRTVRPTTGPSANTARCAVMPGMPRQAPIWSLTLSGRSTAAAVGTTVYWAAVPNGR